MNTDTIAAIATAMTNAGIGIIRISGSDSINIIDNIFLPKNKQVDIKEAKSYTAHYGSIYSNNQVIDECIVLVMRAPNTYTREDVVEIDCHGGVVVMKKILEVVIANGARPAEPGEFTKRAFLNGRIDLSQAEAVMDLISSKNDFAAQSSLNQLKGSLLEKIKSIREDIIYNIAYIESALDDPEHISLDGFEDRLEIVVDKSVVEVQKLISSCDNGKTLREGIKTVIVGKPNAGKSSLLNIFVGEERAIVTDVEGTTRDILEETININGIPLNIIDTAGIRNTNDIVEKIGVDKAREAVNKADLVLFVVDSSRKLDKNDFEIIELIKEKKVIVLMNKIDLSTIVSIEEIRGLLNKDIIEVSAKTEDGINELYEILKDMFFNGSIKFNDEIIITNIRHKNALTNALSSLQQVKNSINNKMPEDFYSIDLMDAYNELGYIIGESLGEDLVNEIFGKFCMGK